MQTAKKYTVAVDFDGVIHSYTSPWQGAHVIPDPPVEGAIEWLRSTLYRFDVAIMSTRNKTWRGRRAMRRWLWSHYNPCGMPFRRWCDKDVGSILAHITFPKHKPPALIYLDDRAWRFEGPGTFPSKDQIHQALPWNKVERLRRFDGRERDMIEQAAFGAPSVDEQMEMIRRLPNVNPAVVRTPDTGEGG